MGNHCGEFITVVVCIVRVGVVVDVGTVGNVIVVSVVVLIVGVVRVRVDVVVSVSVGVVSVGVVGVVDGVVVVLCQTMHTSIYNPKEDDYESNPHCRVHY